MGLKLSMDRQKNLDSLETAERMTEQREKIPKF